MKTVSVLANKRILIGVTGSIACYKAIDLASRLTQAGADTDVILTESASRFVTPLAFRSVTGRSAFTDMWDLVDHVRHVRLGESADIVVIAPATANTIAKLAHGLADNLLTLTALAARCPVLVAPAMDGGMWEHPATQANVATLVERGVLFAGPDRGRMASGLSGTGRMVEAMDLFSQTRYYLSRGGVLGGRKILVTAGPTREALDPVRFLSNRSSGKQGIAVAQAALDAGAEVIVIAGPTSERMPFGADVVNVTSTGEMSEAVLDHVQDADALFMVAAPADYRPVNVSDHKLKKAEAGDSGLRLDLEKTIDILTAVKEQRARSGRPKVVLGFAAETRSVKEYGQDKLVRKGLDFIAVNDVSAEQTGFAFDTNQVLLLDDSGVVEDIPLTDKSAVAERLVHHVAETLLRD